MSIVGDLIGADANRSASNKAADAQVRSTQLATDESRRQYDLYRQDQAPYREAGYAGIDQLKLLLGLGGDPKDANFGALTRQFTGANLQSDPGYQFGLQQGTNAIESSASARGGLFSGATQKALAKYGQDYAGTKFGEAFDRNRTYQTDLFNRLSGLSGTGQQATQSTGAAGQHFADQFGNYNIQGGNARAANYLNQGNILSNLAGKAGDMMGGYFGF